MAQKLKVTQVRSGIGRPTQQNKILKGLGLKGPNRSVVVDNTPAFRGMVKKVLHLVTVEEITELTIFLCSEAGASITGTSIAIDGGWTAH